MKILSVDTTGSAASAALSEDDSLLCEYTLNHKKTHSRMILPMIDKLLSDTETDISQIDLFAVSSGPGSFTGLRIGVATMKGFAYALKKPLIAVNTLEVLAEALPYADAVVVPVIDARNKNVYAAAYNTCGGVLETVFEPMACAIDELLALCAEQEEKSFLFTGDGAVIHREFILNTLESRAAFAPLHALLPRAAALASRAFALYDPARDYLVRDAVPVYLKKSQAERELELKHKREGR